MKCDDARAAYLTGNPENAHLDHLSTCRACLAVSADLETTRGILDDEAVWSEPRSDLEESLVTLISGSASKAPRRGTGRKIWLPAAAIFIAALAAASAIFALSRPADADWEVVLPGTSEAPTASGTVRGWNERTGTRLAFEIDGLEAAPPGSIYEVWFSRGPVHISAGTFKAGGAFEMSAGITRVDYPRIWITLESIDTDESPSGLTVMDTGVAEN